MRIILPLGLIALLLIFSPSQAWGEDEEDDSGWDQEWTFMAGLNHASYSQWTDKFETEKPVLTYVLDLDGTIQRETDKDTWVFELEMNYGKSQLEDLTDKIIYDDIEFDGEYIYDAAGDFDPIATLLIETQFTEFPNPLYSTLQAGLTSRRLISAPGLRRARLSLLAREIMIFSDDPPATNFQWGIKADLRYRKQLSPTLKLDSDLEVFISFARPLVGEWESELASEITKNLVLNLDLDVRYDKKTSEKVQLREVLMLAMSWKF